MCIDQGLTPNYAGRSHQSIPWFSRTLPGLLQAFLNAFRGLDGIAIDHYQRV
jgi:hypothetical protein